MRDQYFHFDHLPPNLQRVCKPFAEAAEAIKRAAGLSGADARKADAAVDDAIGECRAALEGAVDADEAQVADTYLVEVMNLWDGELLGALRLLLCAKDCAIRSHLPDGMALRATDVRGADYEVLLYALIGASAEAEALRKATHAFATHEQAEIVVAPHAVAPGEVMAQAEPSTLKGMYAELKAERSVSAGLRAELAESRQVADLRWRDLCDCQKELDAAVAELAAERVELAKLREDLDVMRDAERDACDEVANLNDQLAELREAVKEWINARDAYMGDILEEEDDLFGTMIQSFYKVRGMVGLRGAPASSEPTTDPIDLNTEG